MRRYEFSSSLLVSRVIDDPVNASPVHLFGGIVGACPYLHHPSPGRWLLRRVGCWRMPCRCRHHRSGFLCRPLLCSRDLSEGDARCFARHRFSPHPTPQTSNLPLLQEGGGLVYVAPFRHCIWVTSCAGTAESPAAVATSSLSR